MFALNDAEVAALARRAVRRDDPLRQPVADVVSLRDGAAPGAHRRRRRHSAFHFFIAFHPPLRQPHLLKYLAGPEIGGGNFLSDTSPEASAAELKALPGAHHAAPAPARRQPRRNTNTNTMTAGGDDQELAAVHAWITARADFFDAAPARAARARARSPRRHGRHRRLLGIAGAGDADRGRDLGRRPVAATSRRSSIAAASDMRRRLGGEAHGDGRRSPDDSSPTRRCRTAGARPLTARSRAGVGGLRRGRAGRAARRARPPARGTVSRFWSGRACRSARASARRRRWRWPTFEALAPMAGRDARRPRRSRCWRRRSRTSSWARPAA